MRDNVAMRQRAEAKYLKAFRAVSELVEHGMQVTEACAAVARREGTTQRAITEHYRRGAPLAGVTLRRGFPLGGKQRRTRNGYDAETAAVLARADQAIAALALLSQQLRIMKEAL